MNYNNIELQAFTEQGSYNRKGYLNELGHFIKEEDYV
jgi:hypothetical protein